MLYGELIQSSVMLGKLMQKVSGKKNWWIDEIDSNMKVFGLNETEGRKSRSMQVYKTKVSDFLLLGV